MPVITTKDGVEIFYKDWGTGQPIVFSYGWPLSSDDWDAQMMFFLNHGFRVVAHDRRGHGRSSQIADGHAPLSLDEGLRHKHEQERMVTFVQDAIHDTNRVVTLHLLGLEPSSQPSF